VTPFVPLITADLPTPTFSTSSLTCLPGLGGLNHSWIHCLGTPEQARHVLDPVGFHQDISTSSLCLLHLFGRGKTQFCPIPTAPSSWEEGGSAQGAWEVGRRRLVDMANYPRSCYGKSGRMAKSLYQRRELAWPHREAAAATLNQHQPGGISRRATK